MAADEPRAELERELRDRLDDGPHNPIWLALHIGCGALALGITGPIEPAPVLPSGDA